MWRSVFRLHKCFKLLDNRQLFYYNKIEQCSISRSMEERGTMKSEITKEKIILETIDLIENSNGNTEEITVRRIAEKAGVGLGLINHYFGSKEQLIEICVQRIISRVVHSFRAPDAAKTRLSEKTCRTVKLVADFLMQNQQISRISILGDMKNPSACDHTFYTASGFASCMTDSISPSDRMYRGFFLVSILQESFLRRDILKQEMGLDLYQKEERDAYIDQIIAVIMGEKL